MSPATSVCLLKHRRPRRYAKQIPPTLPRTDMHAGRPLNFQWILVYSYWPSCAFIARWFASLITWCLAAFTGWHHVSFDGWPPEGRVPSVGHLGCPGQCEGKVELDLCDWPNFLTWATKLFYVLTTPAVLDRNFGQITHTFSQRCLDPS